MVDVELKPYIYTLLKIHPFIAMKSPVLIHNWAAFSTAVDSYVIMEFHGKMNVKISLLSSS